MVYVGILGWEVALLLQTVCTAGVLRGHLICVHHLEKPEGMLCTREATVLSAAAMTSNPRTPAINDARTVGATTKSVVTTEGIPYVPLR